MLIRRPVAPERRFLFYSVDYTGGELVTHAQNCKYHVGYSRLGDALVAGVDVHAALGATMMGVDFDAFWHRYKKLKDLRCKDFRQASKPINFGAPGGMGAFKMALTQRAQGPDTPCPGGPALVYDEATELFVPGYRGLRFCILVDGAHSCGERKINEWKGRTYAPACAHCVDVADRLRKTWFRQWPENEIYLGTKGGGGPVNDALDAGYQVHHWSRRVRGVTEFSSTANAWFQGYLGEIIKEAACRVAKEQYVRVRVRTGPHAKRASRFEGEWSPLLGSRTIATIHDELFGESPEAVAPEAADRVSEIAVEVAREACPDYADAWKADAALARRWYKGMEAIRGADGRLVPWEPSAAA